MLNVHAAPTQVHFRTPTRSDESHRRLVAVSDRAWMERLMVAGTRFREAEFRRLFVEHRRDVAERVLFAAYDELDRPRYFVLDEHELDLPPGVEFGIPYVTELGPLTRTVASRLLRSPFLSQLDRPVLLPADPTGTLADLEALADESLWTPGAAEALVIGGFEARPWHAGRVTLQRRYQHGRQLVAFGLVPPDRGAPFELQSSISGGARLPLPVLNELLLDVARALVPPRGGGYPHMTRVHQLTPCALCGDPIAVGEEAFVYERAIGRRANSQLATLHPSCRGFSLAARFHRGSH